MIQDNKKYVDFLMGKGFAVSEQDGILTVSFGDVSEREAKNKMIEVNDLLDSQGYHKSLGFRWSNRGEAIAKPKSESIPVEEPVMQLEMEDAGQLTFGF